DSLDVFPVHGVGGMIGLLLTAVFSAAAFGGVGLDNGIGGQFVVQVIGIVATLAWCGGATFVLLKVIDMIVPLRVSADDETEGLDLVLHEESGYNL
ncbi:MAG: ammonia channel protein, partial [Gammaproteobacteria bacterium]